MVGVNLGIPCVGCVAGIVVAAVDGSIFHPGNVQRIFHGAVALLPGILVAVAVADVEGDKEEPLPRPDRAFVS